MDIIDKIKEMGSEAYKFTQESTSRIAKETKLKMKISQNKAKIEEYYEEIGKQIYKDHMCEEETDAKEKIDEILSQIDNLSNEIKDVQMELLNLKDKKKCENCGNEIDIEAKYCSECGTKQEEKKNETEEPKDVEIVEDEQ